MTIATVDYGVLTGYPERIDPRELEVGDVVPMVTENHMVMAIRRFEDDPRWTVQVTWEDGSSTLYNQRCFIQRLVPAQGLRNAEQPCIVEVSAQR
jgi:hypothetical protein